MFQLQRHKSLKQIFLISALTSALFSNIAFALPTDRQQPLHIDADHAKMDDAKGVSIYTGNVKIVQGTLLLTGSKVTIHHKGGDIESILTEGDLAHYEQQPELEKDKVYADGEIIEYYVESDTLILKKRAVLKQEGNVFKGEHINYDIAKQKVKATGGTETTYSGSETKSDGRVRIVIQPKKQGE